MPDSVSDSGAFPVVGRWTGAWTDEDGEQAHVDLRDAVTAQDAAAVIQRTAEHEGWEHICWTCTDLPKLAWWRPQDYDDADEPDPEASFWCPGDDYRRRGRSWTTFIEYRFMCGCES
jgi:hypothetical protein